MCQGPWLTHTSPPPTIQAATLLTIVLVAFITRRALRNATKEYETISGVPGVHVPSTDAVPQTDEETGLDDDDRSSVAYSKFAGDYETIPDPEAVKKQKQKKPSHSKTTAGGPPSNNNNKTCKSPQSSPSVPIVAGVDSPLLGQASHSSKLETSLGSLAVDNVWK